MLKQRQLKWWVIALLWVASFSMTTQATPILRYDITYKAHYLECAILMNDKTVFNTARLDSLFPQRVNYSHGITQYVDEGLNKIDVRVADAVYFLINEKAEEAYCSVTVTALEAAIKEDLPKKREVLHLNFTLKEIEDQEGNKKPIVVTEGSRLHGKPISEESILLLSSREKDIYADGSVIIKYSTYDYQTMLEQKADLSWVNRSTPIQDTPAIRELALAKYREISQAIEHEAWDELKELLEPGLSEMAALKFMSREAYFDELREQVFNGIVRDIKYLGWQADVFDPDSYKFAIYANGKLFEFYHLRNNEASPTSWTKGKTRMWFSPVFTLINGEVKVGAM
ncbi:MAG: hypothetical protein GX667_08450 [Xanthomonadaceae bacterium]|nr:hypothetical protein [Xanthomonadaceae bacterium]